MQASYLWEKVYIIPKKNDWETPQIDLFNGEDQIKVKDHDMDSIKTRPTQN